MGLLVVVPVSSAGAAPGFTGATGIVATGASSVRGVAFLPDGSSIVCGSFAGAATFGTTTLTAVGFEDGFVAKRLDDGTYAWATVVGATAGGDLVKSVDIGADGSIFVGGSLDSGSHGRGFVAKLSASGSPAWSGLAEIEAPGAADSGIVRTAWVQDVAAASDGSVIAVGRAQPHSSGSHFVNFGSSAIRLEAPTAIGFASRVDESGHFTWATKLGNGYAPAEAVASLDGGKVAVAGSFSETGSFGSLELTARGTPSGFVARVSVADGAVTSAYVVADSPVSSYVWDVARAPDGDVLIAGETKGATTFPGLSEPVITRADPGAYIARQRPDGAFRWVTVAAISSGGSSTGDALAARGDGSAVLVGTFDGTMTLGGTTMTAASVGDVFVAGVSATGAINWSAHGGPVGPGPYGFDSASAYQAAARPDGKVEIGSDFIAEAGTGATFGPSTVSGGDPTRGVVVDVLDVPTTPAAPTAKAGVESATVTVSPNAGSAITGYQIVASPGGATCTVTPPATECTATGLTAGTAYTFTVAATNAAGTSPVSDASASATVEAPPSGTSPIRKIRVSFVVRGGVASTTFAKVKGASRYAIAAEKPGRAGKARKGTCKAKGKKVTCRVKLTPGSWVVTVTASSKTAVLARGSKTVRVAAPKARRLAVPWFGASPWGVWG